MKAFITICTIVAFAQGASLNNRVVGGQIAAPGQFPYIASLRRDSDNYHFCGATIISRRALLTAAHCMVVDISSSVAVVGTNKQDDRNAKRYPLQSFTIHEHFNPITLANDVAVIILAEDIAFSDMVVPEPLASRPVNDYERVTAAGWGLTDYPANDYPNDLQWMQMNALPDSKCTMMTGDRNLVDKICTLESKGHGVCLGDSGGPLINDQDEVTGIASSVYLCATGMPDVFTDVFYFKDWIADHAYL